MEVSAGSRFPRCPSWRRGGGGQGAVGEGRRERVGLRPAPTRTAERPLRLPLVA